MLRETYAEINLDNLRHNLELLRKWNGPHFFCPMVKANAYGHGEHLVAPVAAQRADALGVALVEEGLRLRELGITLPILTFSPLNQAAADAVLKNNLTPVIGRFEDLKTIAALKPKSVSLHLKFNTGMQRIGFDEADLNPLQQWLKDHPAFQVSGCCTHLTHGEDAQQPEGPSQIQFRKFLNLAKAFPGVRHAHKSATLATLTEKKQPAELGARPGIAIYGLPHEGNFIGPGLKPVLRWSTRLAYVHNVEKGEHASYGATWIAPRRSWVGVVPMGYGDGYSRSFSNKGEMLFRGRRAPVVGRVCMDYTLLDLTEVCGQEKPQPGEEVVVLGRQGSEELTAFDLANRVGTNAYEIVTSISARVARKAL